MARHSYRVTNLLPWIEDCRLGPNFTVLSGRPVLYKPGETVNLDDREVPSIAHHLEAVDEGGRKVLEDVRARATGRAKRTLVSALDPKDRAWLIRATDEKFRRAGKIRELVDRLLARGAEPTLDDIVAALRDAEPPSPALIEFVVKLLTLPQRPGPKQPRRTTLQDLAIKAYYTYELDQAKRAHEANSRRSRAFADVAKRSTAKAFRISKRTVERVVALRPTRKTNL